MDPHNPSPRKEGEWRIFPRYCRIETALVGRTFSPMTAVPPMPGHFHCLPVAVRHAVSVLRGTLCGALRDALRDILHSGLVQ